MNPGGTAFESQNPVAFFLALSRKSSQPSAALLEKRWDKHCFSMRFLAIGRGWKLTL